MIKTKRSDAICGQECASGGKEVKEKVAGEWLLFKEDEACCSGDPRQSQVRRMMILSYRIREAHKARLRQQPAWQSPRTIPPCFVPGVMR